MESLLKRYGFFEWCCHSNFSFLIGASHPHEYVERAAALGYRGIGLSDFDGVYGSARAYRSIKTLLRQDPNLDLKLFYAAEIHLEKDHTLPIVEQNTLILLAQNLRGYENLCRILSFSHRESKREAFVRLNDLASFDLEGLCALVPMRGLLRRGQNTQWTAQCQSLYAFFAERLFFILTRLLNPAEDIWLSTQLEQARHLGARVLISQDPFMHEPEQKDLSDVLQAMRLNQNVSTSGRHLFVNAERHLHSLKTIEQLYGGTSFFERALKNAHTLQQSCEFSFQELRYRYPKEMIPTGYSAQGFLESLTWTGAHQYYGNPLPQKIQQTLERELKLIAYLEFADYFLTVWDVVRWAREQNILCQGRGSAANSAVCFVLGITAVDPNLFDLLFERFMSVERGDPPDIDIDFEHERREEVIQYIYQRYGRSRAAMVANVICFKTRGALRFTAKALGVPDHYLDQLQQNLKLRASRRSPSKDIIHGLKISAEDQHPQFIHTLQLLAQLAARVRGFPRHLGIHSGGFMIADRNLDGLVPQEPATMPGRTVIQWSKEDVEALGFFKIDFLALGMLSAIRKTFDYVSTHYKRSLTLKTIPADDPATYAMIQIADTVGTFQIESRAQISMLTRLKPRNFYDLVIEVAIIRPGPIQGGMIHPYLERRDGKAPITYAHPSLEPILKRTLGIPIFQEQVMRIAMTVGDFTPGEADELRRSMGAWQMKGDLNPCITRLISGMRRRKIKEEFIMQLVNQLKGFAEYGFPESHAASFALIAYASSYLKCHYPAAFCTALLNSQPMGFYSRNALIQDARRHGVEVLSICVNHSSWQATLTDDKQIRLGFEMVYGLPRERAEYLIAQRPKDGGWRDLDHFLNDSQLNRLELTCLAAANAFQCFGIARRDAVWLSEAARFAPYLEDPDLLHQFHSESPYEKIQLDFQSTGTSLGEHPTHLIRERYWCFAPPQKQMILARDLNTLTANTFVHTFGMVLVRQAPPTAKGMVFFTLEDETGFINLVFTPQVYARFSEMINAQGFLCVGGKLQRSDHNHSILVRTVYQAIRSKAQVYSFEADEDENAFTKNQIDYIAEVDQTRNYM